MKGLNNSWRKNIATPEHFANTFPGLVLLLLCLSSSLTAQLGNEDRCCEQEIQSAIRLYPNSPHEAHERLEALGSRAFPRLLEVIDEDSYGNYSRVFKVSRLNPFLLSVIEQNDTPASENALIGLLKRNDNLMKGMALLALGRKKSVRSLPCITALLSDTSTYLVVRVTDSLESDSTIRNEPVLMRDNAVQALEDITGIVLKAKSQKAKAGAWIRWAEKEKIDSHCG